MEALSSQHARPHAQTGLSLAFQADPKPVHPHCATRTGRRDRLHQRLSPQSKNCAGAVVRAWAPSFCEHLSPNFASSGWWSIGAASKRGRAIRFPTDPSLSLSLGRRRRGCNNPRAFARNRRETGSLETAPSATQSRRCSRSGIARGQPQVCPWILGAFSGRGRGAGETRGVRRGVASGARAIVSRARFRGPGWERREPLPGTSRAGIPRGQVRTGSSPAESPVGSMNRPSITDGIALSCARVGIPHRVIPIRTSDCAHWRGALCRRTDLGCRRIVVATRPPRAAR